VAADDYLYLEPRSLITYLQARAPALIYDAEAAWVALNNPQCGAAAFLKGKLYEFYAEMYWRLVFPSQSNNAALSKAYAQAKQLCEAQLQWPTPTNNLLTGLAMGAPVDVGPLQAQLEWYAYFKKAYGSRFP
jgi:hypothetical protein